MVAQIYIPTNSMRVPFSPHPWEHLLVVFTIMAILAGVRWCCGFGLHVSLINTDFEHPFVCLATCMTSVAKYLLRSSVHLKFVCFFPFWSCHTACGILVPQLGTKTLLPTVEAWSLNHWTTRKVLIWVKFGHNMTDSCHCMIKTI